MTAMSVVLVGLSGSGKSTVGRIMAERLGFAFADSDEAIVSARGAPITEIFGLIGEARFRVVEAETLAELAGRKRTVVASGGGALTTREGRQAAARGFVIWLRISADEAALRLHGNPDTEDRPLLAGDVHGRLLQMERERRHLYARADAIVDVDGLSPEAVAERAIVLYTTGQEAVSAERLEMNLAVAATVQTATGGARCDVIVANGALARLGEVCRESGLKGRAFVLTDSNVGPRFASRVAQSLEDSGYATETFVMPSGEQTKNLGTVAKIYDWLLERRIERGDFLVNVGGGVVTDVGGFVAATVLRGVAFVHVPTTTLGMVDASIGGKTGVDHERGKNVIGVFAQPRVIVMDPETLATLPERELRAGWAEFIKHGFILDPLLIEHVEALELTREALADAQIVAWSAAIKARVVSGDEREEGQRTLLNYGHTFGHAIEAVTGYSSYLHGEAVSIGMRGAGMISVEMGLLKPEEFERQQRLVRKVGLPESAPGVSVEAVLAATLGDKKVSGGRIKWVLLKRLGEATTHSTVPPEVVRRAAEAILPD